MRTRLQWNNDGGVQSSGLSPQSAALSPRSCWSSSHCEFKESVCSIERRLDRGVYFVVDDLATAKYLHLSIFKGHVHQDADQIFAQRVNVVEVRKHASEASLDGFLHRLESGSGGRFQATRAVASAARARGDVSFAEGESDLDPALTPGFFLDVGSIESQTFLSSAD